MKRKFYFRCGNFAKRNFIYAIKSVDKEWHYFEEKDTLSSAHGMLPAIIDSFISTLTKISTIEVPLDEHQWKIYIQNEKFVFNNKELKTYMAFADDKPDRTASKKKKATDELVFVSGISNPLIFLNEYEKCSDLKNEKDKMFKIRNFVDSSDRTEFSEMYFTSDWQTVRHAFLRKYSSRFTENKKKELNIDFYSELNLRSFVERKLKSLSSYTTMPLINQIEMVLYDLPNEISNLFLTHEIMTKTKAEILDFCESVQDLVLSMSTKQDKEEEVPAGTHNPLNSLEIFTYNASESHTSNHSSAQASESEWGESGESSMSVDLPSKTKRNRGPESVAKRGRGRPRKTLKKIPEETTDSDVEYLSRLPQNATESNTPNHSSAQASESEWGESSEPSMSVDLPSKIKSKRGPESVAKRGRGRPRKTLKKIPEETTDSDVDCLSHLSDASNVSRRYRPY